MTREDPRWTVVPMRVTAANTAIPSSVSSHAKHQRTHLHHHNHQNHASHHNHPASQQQRPHPHTMQNHHHHNDHLMQTPTSFHPSPSSATAAAVSPSRRKCPIHHEQGIAGGSSKTLHHSHHQSHTHSHPVTGASGSISHSKHHHRQDHQSKFHSTSSRGSSSSPSDSDHEHDMVLVHESTYQYPEADIIEEKVYITLKTGQSLGCSVVRGPAAYPGIFVQHVKPNSLSATSGLEVGDQILAMNGFSFYPGHYNFDDAINKIKACTQMTLTVRKRVGLHLFHELKHKNNVHQIRAMVHSPHENDSDYDPEKDFDLSAICGIHACETDVKQVSGNNSSSSTAPVVVTGTRTLTADEVLLKVRMEEERLAEDRRILAAEQIKLQQEMQRLAIERKELEALRLQGKSDDGGSSISSGDVSMLSSSSSPDPLACCSVSVSASCNSSTASSCDTSATTSSAGTMTSVTGCSSSSSSSSGIGRSSGTGGSNDTPALGFLDELKQLAEKRSSSDSGLLLDTLRKTAGASGANRQNHANGSNVSDVTTASDQETERSGGRIRLVKQMIHHPDDEKRKRHELLMEEFRSAHLKMFGKSSTGSVLTNSQSPASSASQALAADKRSQVAVAGGTCSQVPTAGGGRLSNDAFVKSTSNTDEMSAASGKVTDSLTSGQENSALVVPANGVRKASISRANAVTPASLTAVRSRRVITGSTTAATAKAPSSFFSPGKTGVTSSTTAGAAKGNGDSASQKESACDPRAGNTSHSAMTAGRHDTDPTVISSSSSPASQEKRSAAEKVVILKTSSSQPNGNNVTAGGTAGLKKSQPPPPPPPPLPTATAAGGQPLVTITSYQAKQAPRPALQMQQKETVSAIGINGRSNGGPSSQAANSQSTSPPVKINLIRSSSRDSRL